MTTIGLRAVGALAAGVMLSGAAQATALVGRGGAIFDPSTNLEWLWHANLAEVEHFGVLGIRDDGRMSWETAQAWIAAMNAASFLGGGWRLPLTAQPDPTCGSQFDAGSPYPLQGWGYNCTGSELGDLFYNKLGGKAGQSVLDQSGDSTEEMENFFLFEGHSIQSSVYWSGAEAAPYPTDAWLFLLSDGSQSIGGKGNLLYAWPVRPAVVPLPEAGLLFGSVLVGLGAARRKAAA